MTSRKPGLQRLQFQCVAAAGIGDSGNSYAHAMAWFRDHLYVGTGRHFLAAIYASEKARRHWIFETAPVRVPDRLSDLDFRAQIWRYHPPTDKWEQVMTSPTVQVKPGVHRPVLVGMRNMAVFQAATDAAPVLYGTSFSGTGGTGVLVRSENGTDFDLVEFRGFDAEGFSTFRPLVPFRGRLFTGTTGGKQGSGNACGIAAVLTTRDPVTDPWVLANADNFGDPHNEGVFEMAVFNDHLYAGTISSAGAQLWKTDGAGQPPFRWTKVFDAGAGRGSHNQCIASFGVLRDALYVGLMTIDGGFDRDKGNGPCAAEMVRVFADDRWEIVCGDGRLTDQGLKLPISGLGPGFNNPMNGYIWRIAEYEGVIYAGTYCAASAIPFLDRKKLTPETDLFMSEDRCNLVMDLSGGFDLWRSPDGVLWRPVTLNGFGIPFNAGVRSLLSTPQGLFVGAINGYGPDVAVKRMGGWRYEPNPRGGCEIWMGRHDLRPSSQEEAARGFDGGRAKQIEERPLPRPREPGPGDDPVQHVIADFYRGSGFRSRGYWTRHVHRADEAGERLLTELTSMQRREPSRILEIGADTEVTAAYLARRYEKAKVAAVAFPRGRSLPRGPFDLVLNVESLSTRPDALAWLGHILGVLEPGGSWLSAVVLSEREDSPWRRGRSPMPVQDAAAFERLLVESGFADVTVHDATRACWDFFCQRLDQFLMEAAIGQGLDQQVRADVKDTLTRHLVPVSAYLLVSARKPGG